MPLIVSNRNRHNIEVVAFDRMIPSLREFGSILLTFTLTMLAWVFFRAESVTHAITYIKQIFTIIIFVP
jgi:D-alanyl-lipoteichoic acid acyltransferase DltB (MBOAT superfamily)